MAKPKAETDLTALTISLVINFLGVLFVALKLSGVVTWSWLVVLMPFWVPAGLLLLLLLSIVILRGAIGLAEDKKKSR